MRLARLARGDILTRGFAAAVAVTCLTRCARTERPPPVAPAALPASVPTKPAIVKHCPCACEPLVLTALQPVRANASSAVQAEFLPDLLTVPAANAAASPAVSFDRVLSSVFRFVHKVAEPSDEVELCLDRLTSQSPLDVTPPSVHSKSVHVYDVKRAEFAPGGGEAVLVLYSRFPPQSMTDGALVSEWRVALLGKGEELLSDLAFTTRIPYLASWDTTDTVLREEHGVAVAHVVYAMSCGAKKQAQSFSVPISVGLSPPCLRAGSVHHDGYLF